MSGRLKDGHGIMEPARTVAALNAAGIPTIPFDDGPVYVAYTAGVATVGDSIEYVTLRFSTDWAELGGNEDDLDAVYATIVAALTDAGVPFLAYWGPGSSDTARNILLINGFALTLSAEGWPNSDTHG